MDAFTFSKEANHMTYEEKYSLARVLSAKGILTNDNANLACTKIVEHNFFFTT